MGSIALLYRNIYESSDVTVTTEDSDYPAYRLHDRDIGKLYKGTSTAYHFFTADQGPSVQYAVDALIIPSGHNLYGGSTHYWRYSDNGVDWSNFIGGWAGTAGQIVKEASPAIHRYWQIKISNPASPPELPELWMGQKVELADVIAWGYQEGLRGNVEKIESLSGRPHFLINGEDREYRNYLCKIRDSDVRDDLEGFFIHSRGKPFWLRDLDGEWYYASLVDPNIGPFQQPSLNRFDLQLEMIEVLP